MDGDRSVLLWSARHSDALLKNEYHRANLYGRLPVEYRQEINKVCGPRHTNSSVFQTSDDDHCDNTTTSETDEENFMISGRSVSS